MRACKGPTTVACKRLRVETSSILIRSPTAPPESALPAVFTETGPETDSISINSPLLITTG